MRAPMIVGTDPVANSPVSMLQGFKVAMDALLLQRPEHPFHLAILLRGIGRDEFLAQAIALHQSRVAAAGKDQAVVV